MIISHAHRFIFFAVPKTGTQAVRQALSAHIGPDDWQQHALYSQARLPIPALAAKGHGHLPVREPKRITEVWLTGSGCRVRGLEPPVQWL